MNNNFGNDRPFCRREDTVYAATVWRTWYCRNVGVLVLVLTESLPRSLRRPVFIWPNNHYCRRVFCYFTAHQTVKCPQSWVFVDLVNPLRPLEDHENKKSVHRFTGTEGLTNSVCRTDVCFRN